MPDSIDYIRVDDEDLLAQPVPFESTPEQTAEAIARQINESGSDRLEFYAEGSVIMVRERRGLRLLWYMFRRWLRRLFKRGA